MRLTYKQSGASYKQSIPNSSSVSGDTAVILSFIMSSNHPRTIIILNKLLPVRLRKRKMEVLILPSHSSSEIPSFFMQIRVSDLHHFPSLKDFLKHFLQSRSTGDRSLKVFIPPSHAKDKLTGW